MNTWEAVIEYMNMHVGEIGSRQGLISHIERCSRMYGNWNNHEQYIQVVQERQRRKRNQSFTTIDCYKNYLVQAGLIHKIRMDGKTLQGKFYIPKKIDQFITVKEVREKAYGPKLMIMGVDRGMTNPCASAGHYYIGSSNEGKGYILKEDTSNYADTKPREPEFLSKDDFKL